MVIHDHHEYITEHELVNVYFDDIWKKIMTCSTRNKT